MAKNEQIKNDNEWIQAHAWYSPTALSPNGSNGCAEILAPTLATLECTELECRNDWDLGKRRRNQLLFHFIMLLCYNAWKLAFATTKSAWGSILNQNTFTLGQHENRK